MRALLQAGSTVGRYLILHPVGQGGMGVVYAAYDPELDRKVALKLLKVYPQQLDEDGQARLLREAQALARVSHPNVTAVYDTGTYGTQVFVAMELIEGGKTLGGWLCHKPRSWQEILDVMVEAGRGLAAAHAAGLVHRDFKPENVLVSQDGHAHVTDFGLARPASTENTGEAELPPQRPVPPDRPHPADPGGGPLPAEGGPQVGTVAGTPTYMAPEQHLGRPPSFRSDQFSFCTALYYALYGQHPFDPKELAAAVRSGAGTESSNLIQPPLKSPFVPAWVKQVLQRGLQLSPEDRFDSMDALLSRLARPRATARWRWAAGLLLVLAGAGVLAQRELAARRSMLCSGTGQSLRGAWEPDVERQVKSAFEATGTPYSSYAFQTVKSILDGYARDWAAMHTEACQATRVRGEQTEAVLTLRMTCLDRRLKELQALTTLFTKVDTGTLQHAVEAVGQLPRISTCADVDALSAPVPPPEDAPTRAEVSRLTTQLAQTKVLGVAGKYKPALEQAEGLVEAARSIHYLPLLAEALVQKGQLLRLLGRSKDAEHVLLSAWAAAEGGRTDEVRVRAAAELIGVFINDELDKDEALRWVELGEAALNRIGRAPGAEILLRRREGVALSDVGQYPRAIEDLERALALDEKVNGGGSVERPLILMSLARIHRRMGNLERAIHFEEEAAGLDERIYGPDHPTSGLAHSILGELYLSQGDIGRAVQHARKGLAVLERALGPEHVRAGEARDVLTLALVHQQRFDEALEYARRSLAIADKVLEPSHWARAWPLHNLAYVYLETGRANQALPLLERAMKLHNLDSDVLASLRFHLARALVETGGERSRARALAEQALEEYRARGDKRQAGEVEHWLRTTAR